MKNMRKSNSHPDDVWEKRELGTSEAHVRRVSPTREKLVDDSLGLQMISLRLQRDLIEDLKQLAQEAGIGYQTYIRQFLNRHVQGKKKREARMGGTVRAAKPWRSFPDKNREF